MFDSIKFGLEEIVTNPRPWPGAESLGIPPYIGEQLDKSSVLFADFYKIKDCYFKGVQLYVVSDWGTYDGTNS